MLQAERSVGYRKIAPDGGFMFNLFEKLVSIITSIVTVLTFQSYAPTPTVSPEPSNTPAESASVPTPTPTPSNTSQPTPSPTHDFTGLIKQLNELKQQITAYTPEPKPTPQVIIIQLTPTPTSWPQPTSIPTITPRPIPQPSIQPTPTPVPTPTPPSIKSDEFIDTSRGSQIMNPGGTYSDNYQLKVIGSTDSREDIKSVTFELYYNDHTTLLDLNVCKPYLSVTRKSGRILANDMPITSNPFTWNVFTPLRWDVPAMPLDAENHIRISLNCIDDSLENNAIVYLKLLSADGAIIVKN